MAPFSASGTIQLISLCSFLTQIKSDPPPQTIPQNLRNQYTMGNKIPALDYFVDDTLNGRSIQYSYNQNYIDNLIATLTTQLSEWGEYLEALPVTDKSEHVRTPLKPYKFDESSIPQRFWPLVALHRYRHLFSSSLTPSPMTDNLEIKKSSQQGAKVIVFGSVEPWAEAMSLALGAASVTTVEYNDLTLEHSDIETIHPDELKTRISNGETWDIALAFSTFHHDGLGRYGDPLNPEGDLEAMDWMKRAVHLKSGVSQCEPNEEEEEDEQNKSVKCCNNNTDNAQVNGIAFLSVPVGSDLLVWNLHRQYGRLRLPLLLNGWHVTDRIGWDEDRFKMPSMNTHHGNFRKTFDPILVISPDAPQSRQFGL